MSMSKQVVVQLLHHAPVKMSDFSISAVNEGVSGFTYLLGTNS